MSQAKPLLISLLSLLLIHSTSLAFCDHVLEGHDEVQINRQYDEASHWCTLEIHPRNAFETLIYRDYLMDNYGLMMVFNSYGPGPESEKTGAREYYFFPRLNAEINYKTPELGSNQDVQVQMASGKWLSFSTKNADLTKLEKGQFLRDPEVNSENKGGIEITHYDGLWLDVGFALGHSPTDDKKSKSLFHDSNGNTCALANSQIFNYSNNNSIIKSDSEISKLLKRQCQNLNVPF